MATINVPDTGNPATNMTNLQLAVNNAARGDTITLVPRVIYRGNLVLPPTAGTTDILITTNQPSLIASAGIRINIVTHLAGLPILEVATNNIPAVQTCNPSAGVSSHFILRGLEIRANAFGGGNLVQLGSADTLLANKQDTSAKVPTDLTIDRCYIHGLPFTGQKRGVSMDCLRGTIIESYISDCWGIGQDTQAIGGSNGLGTYVIRNSYLEGAGENVLMGGADPIIPNLVPTGLTFTRNDVSRPVAWRSPILSTPTGVVVNIGGTGGTLPAATYGYRVMARCTSYAGNIARSTPAATVSVTITLGQLPQVSWAGVSGATSYYVYRTGPSGTERFSTTTLSFADSGTTGVTEAVPGTGTVRAVKNLFELKNFDTATVVGNRFSNHWVESQPGPAIVFTPVNQDGGNNNTVVQNVLFAYNRVDSVAGVYAISSHDAQSTLRVSRRANHIVIRHNLHTNVGSAWGAGNLRELNQTSGSTANTFEGTDFLTYEHNTTLSSGLNSMVYFSEFSSTLGFPKSTNLIIRNNLARRGSFGIFGSNSGEGNVVLNDYCTAATCTRNAIVGISTSQYPAGNFGPTETVFQAQFVSYAGGDYQLASTSIYKGQATDGTDLGCEIDVMDALYAGTVTPPFTVTWAAVGGSGTLYITTGATCDWTAVSSVSWVTVTNGANHTGTGTVTYTVTSNPGAARQGVISVAGTSVTIVQVGTGVAVVAVPKGTLTLAGAAPTGKRTFVLTPAAAALSWAGLAASDLVTTPTTIVQAPPKGALTLVGAVPTLGGTATELPGVGALVVAGRAPTAIWTVTAAPSVGALTFAGLAVTRVATLSGLPSVGALVLLGRAPTRSLGQFPALDVGVLSFAGAAPSRLELIPRVTSTGAMALAGLAPTTPQAHRPPLGVGALALIGLTPTGGRTFVVSPAAGALILLSTPGGANTLFSRVPDTGRLVLLGAVPTIPQALLVQPGAGTLTLAGLAPVRAADTNRQPLLGGLNFTGHLVGSFATYRALTTIGSLTLAGRAPSVGQTYLLEPSAGTLLIVGAAPSPLGVGTITPSVGALTLAGLTPSRTLQLIFAGTAGALLLSGRAPAITISGGVAVTAAPSQALLTLVGLAPLNTEGVMIEVPAGALLLESLVPPIYACEGLVSPTLITVIAAGGIVIITVDIGDLCPWTAVSLDSWLGVDPAADTGPGTVVVTVDPHTDTVDPREGALDIAGTRVVVVQVADDCSFTVTPASVHASATLTLGTLTIDTTTGCSWEATTAASWITLTGASGTGDGTVSYTLAENLLTSARTGTILAAGHVIPVLQRGRNANPSPRDCPDI